MKFEEKKPLEEPFLAWKTCKQTYERAAKCKQRDEYPINLPKYFDKSY